MAGPNAPRLATPYGSDMPMLIDAPALSDIPMSRENTPGDFEDAWYYGAEYLRYMQADITEDNAGNGGIDSDTQDGGWDWNPTIFEHSGSASALNVYGVSVLGLYNAYVAYEAIHGSGSAPASWLTAMKDAADGIVARSDVKFAADFIFLVKYAALTSTPSYAAVAKAKYDAKVGSYASATAFAEYIRDARGISQGYPNGIIAWDIGAYVEAAAALHTVYSSDGYDADADAMAEVLWQDSFNDTPGLFDIDDDNGFDITDSNPNYWWYNLGISGLIRAFVAADVHTSELPDLASRILASQYSFGAISDQFGANPDGFWSWQATAYCAMALDAYDAVTYETAIANMAYWLSATQDQASGAWLYGDLSHIPEVGGEATAAMSLGNPLAVTETEVGMDVTGYCLSTVDTCLTVPFDLVRGAGDIGPARGISVTFALSPELTTCGSIAEGNWLDDFGTNTVYQVIDHMDGSYTVDQAILGSSCGEYDGGLLFSVPVRKANAVTADDTGVITITGIVFRDCDNQPLSVSAGDPVSIPINIEVPAAITSLAAAQVKTGNPSGNTTNVNVSFTFPGGDVTMVHVYRAPYGTGDTVGSYPEYDDTAGAGVPVPTATPPAGAPWALVGSTATGSIVDYTTDRGYWYYVAYAEDECNNISAVSNMTGGTLNYHLGDVASGGDNDVGGLDVSLLGASYGYLTPPASAHLDVGPTSDFSVDGLPLTDNVINFEDLIMFAINYGVVSATDPLENAIDLSDPANLPTLTLQKPTRSLNGTVQARLVLDQSTDLVQGVHAVIEYDPSSVEIVGVHEGDLLDGAFFGTFGADGSVVIDGAALGTGATIHGSGAYAVIEYRPLNPQASIALSEVSLRDVRNRDLLGHDVAENGRTVFETNESPSLDRTNTPMTTLLLGAYPNPVTSSTSIRFQLAQEENVRLEIFDVSGRLLRTVYSGVAAAGEHAVDWDGRTDSGAAVHNGVYPYRLQVAGKIWTQKLSVSR